MINLFLNYQSSKLSSGYNLAVNAENNLLLLTAQNAATKSDESKSSSTSTTTQTQAASNLNTINNLNLLATKNLNISASNLQTTAVTANLNLTSETGDVNLLAGINSSTISTSNDKRDFDSIGFSHTHSSVGIDFTQSGKSDTITTTQTSLASSNLVSANNININSGSLLSIAKNSGSTNILASNLNANNQININANNQLNIQSQEQATNIVNSHSNITNTITLSVGNAWLGLADSTVQSAKRVEDSNNSKTDDKAKAANATAASAQIGMNILQALITAPSYGFYGAATETLSTTTSESQTNYTTNLASNLIATNSINLNSNSNLSIKGSNLVSQNGNINLRSKEGNVNIEAAQNSLTSNSSSQTNSISETVSVSGGGVFISIPIITNSRSSSDYNASSYLASNINATNGTININAKDDTNVIGSNLLAKDINLATTNLNLESLQSKLSSHSESDSYSLGGNIGFESSKQNQDRLWTDNIASIIATNNTSITGALIANITNATEIGLGSTLLGGSESTRSATMGGSLINATDGGNLTLNTKTLTTANLNDYNNQSSSSLGFSVAIPVGLGTPTNSQGQPMWNQGLKPLFAPAYSTIGLNYAANQTNQEQITKATIGGGTINLNSNIARDEKTGEVISIATQTNDTNNQNTEQLANSNNNSGKTTNEATKTTNQKLSSAEAANSDLTNLNRNINQVQQTTQNHTSGGYNIDLNVNFGILNQAYKLNQQGKLLEQGKENLSGTSKLLYKLTPMGVNQSIEVERGSDQTLAWGEAAVYKSGNEPNGIRSEDANNVGQQFVPRNKDGSVNFAEVGNPVKFDTVLDFVISSKEGGLVSQTCNYGILGCNDMSKTHDPLAGYLKKTYPQIPEIITKQGTIIPVYIYNTYGLIGKPVNMAIDYIKQPATTTNLTPILNSISAPTLNQNFSKNDF